MFMENHDKWAELITDAELVSVAMYSKRHNIKITSNVNLSDSFDVS